MHMKKFVQQPLPPQWRANVRPNAIALLDITSSSSNIAITRKRWLFSESTRLPMHHYHQRQPEELHSRAAKFTSHSVSLPTETAQYGSIRKQWRPYLNQLRKFPLLQKFALEAASFFTNPKDLDFNLPRNFYTKYELAKKLGEGAFGRVHKVIPVNARTDEYLDLAVKIIPKTKVVSLKDYKSLQQEGRMMILLGGTLNVVHFFGAYEDDQNVYLVMEHCVGGDASERLQVDNTPKRESLCATYMADILHVVWQCHLLRILHGDLKLENFLFADDQETSPLKLTDFGGAAFVQDGEMLTDLRGTPLYTAPEVLKGKYSFPSDLWSCGVILYRLLSGRFPFEEGPLLDERIQHEEVDFSTAPWPSISQDAKDLVRKLLERDPNTRLTAEQALQHPWLSSAHESSLTIGTPRPDEPPPVSPLMDGTMVQRLQLYRTLNSFQHAVLYEIARILPLETKQEVMVLFSEISRDGSMQVGTAEFAAYLESGGYRLTLGEAKFFLNGLDLDGDRVLSLDEFCAAFLDWAVIQKHHPELWESVVAQVFERLDRDQDERLSVEDLAQMASFDVQHSSQRHSFRNDLMRCFHQADVNANGSIDLDDFQRMLQIQPTAYDHFARRLKTHDRHTFVQAD